jgi:hypothetical protein
LLNGVSNGTGVFVGLNANNYNVMVTDANGCSYALAFTIDQPALLTLSLNSQSNIACHGTSTGSVIVIASGGTTGYSYSVVTQPTFASAVVTGNVITNMIAGAYVIRVTDAHGCTADLSVNISQPAAALDITTVAAIITDPTCHNGANGIVNITVTGGTAPYSYDWSSGDNVQDPNTLSAGTYFVTVTDAGGCQIVGGPYVINNPAAVTIAVSGIVNTQCNAAVGSVVLTSSDASAITVGAVTLPSGSTFTGLAAGYYTAISNGSCPATVNFSIINNNSNLFATVNVTNPLCNGTLVTATITAIGGTAPYTFSINGGVPQGSGVFAGLGAGNYNALVTDHNGCTYALAFTIDQPTLLVAEMISSTNINCFGASTGSATVSATGGTTPYTYAWSTTPVLTTASVSGLPAGTYTVTVTDANGCSKTSGVTISSCCLNRSFLS